MKRSAALAPLSRDHHAALFTALRLKRAEDPSAGAVFVEFLDRDGSAHFGLEEAVLLPVWMATDRDADRQAASRMLAEHLEMRIARERILGGMATLDDIHALGELIESHVRFEERELFPMIEAGLDDKRLAYLGPLIERRG